MSNNLFIFIKSSTNINRRRFCHQSIKIHLIITIISNIESKEDNNPITIMICNDYYYYMLMTTSTNLLTNFISLHMILLWPLFHSSHLLNYHSYHLISLYYLRYIQSIKPSSLISSFASLQHDNKLCN